MKSVDETTKVGITLELEPNEFKSKQDEFVLELANLLGIASEEVRIMEVNYGCTNLVLQIPIESRRLFDLIKMDHPDLPAQTVKDAYNFRRKWLISANMELPSDLASFSLVAPRPKGNSVTWMHISDAHFESRETGGKRDFWGQDKIRRSFIQQLPRMLSAENLLPDFIFFTGDIAFSGQKKEYDIAIDFIESLRKSVPNGDDIPVMTVPGNHDIDRGLVTRFGREEEYAKSFLNDHKAILEYMGSPKHSDDRERVFMRLNNYFEFAQNCLRFGHPDYNRQYYYSKIFQCRDLSIGIAGLNSAWRCASNDDRYNLILGIPQIDDAIDTTSGADIKIALLHHPPGTDWYVSDDMIYQRDALISNFDFLLHGHEHDPSDRFTGSNGIVSAGALYSREHRPQSVNVVSLDLDTNQGWIFFWRLAESKFRWVKDVDLCDEGYDLFAIGSDANSISKKRA